MRRSCLLIVALSAWGFSGCQPETTEAESSSLGDSLAKTHCVTCHAYPEPKLLDSATWARYVLPRMGYMLGIYDAENPRASLLEDGPGGARVARAGLYPEKPVLDAEGWAAIRAFYLREAPRQLPQADSLVLSAQAPPFRVKGPRLRLSPPSTTLIRMQDTSGRFFVGDANTRALYVFDRNLQMQGAANVPEGAVWMVESEDELFLLAMGSFSPTDAPSGLLMSLPARPGGQTRVLIDSLQRPVHLARADFNQDGRADLIICEFGKWTGRLAWWEQLADGSYRPHPLRQTPGAIKSQVADLNRDRKPDIVALFGQGKEEIVAFLNEGKGRFRTQSLLAFPASYGSSYLQLVDWDRDGRQDLLYCAGDNADYPPVYKPYHGIYLFLQKEDLQFEPHFHLPYPGAYQARPIDFDEDGDLDLAAISFFPDFGEQPNRGFLYLENDGADQFTAHLLPQALAGRWLVLDAGDLDGDRDVDLLLGSLAFEVVPPNGLVEQWTRQGIPFLLLENTLR